MSRSSPITVAVVWRNDGVIEYVIPASTLVNTFFAIVIRHVKWLCQLVDELALVTTQDNAPSAIDERQSKILVAIKKGLFASDKSHALIEESQSRLKVGTDDYFPGMFYGTMHPTELAVLADEIEGVMENITITNEEGREALDSIIVWRDAAKKFVRPSEKMGSMMGEVGIA